LTAACKAIFGATTLPLLGVVAACYVINRTADHIIASEQNRLRNINDIRFNPDIMDEWLGR
jgi:tellurite resistance protein